MVRRNEEKKIGVFDWQSVYREIVAYVTPPPFPSDRRVDCHSNSQPFFYVWAQAHRSQMASSPCPINNFMYATIAGRLNVTIFRLFRVSLPSSYLWRISLHWQTFEWCNLILIFSNEWYTYINGRTNQWLVAFIPLNWIITIRIAFHLALALYSISIAFVCVWVRTTRCIIDKIKSELYLTELIQLTATRHHLNVNVIRNAFLLCESYKTKEAIQINRILSVQICSPHACMLEWFSVF